MQHYPLVQTKLYMPPVRPDLVRRPHLIERLDAGLRRPDGALTLVSAPAGFGKTTLVSEWLHEVGSRGDAHRVAWLSLDEDDNDLSRFLVYVVAALSRIKANIGKGVLNQLRTSPPPVEEILTFLINVMATLPVHIILVLDDYHLIQDQAIHDALAFLLARMPHQFHLVISTREDPYLPLARLRARGQLTELRASDLRFTAPEAAEFLNKVMGLALSAQDIAALETRTEGWIAGLQLAALSMQGRQDLPGFIQSFTGSHRFVLDYLVEEVLDRQPEDIQTFLLHTAILDRLSGPLCDAVCSGGPGTPGSSSRTAVCFGPAETPGNTSGTAVQFGPADGQATLEKLDRANLFIVPLDSERRWYRYHHLFADLLRQRLGQSAPQQVTELHRRASEWYEQQDMPSDAIRHALAAGDQGRAADLAELAWPKWDDSYRAIAWLGWLKDLPDELVRARPVLSMAYAWAFLHAGKLEDADARLRDVERCLEPEGAVDRPVAASEHVVVDEQQFQALPIQLATARAYHAQAAGDLRGTERYVHSVLELLPEDDDYGRASIIGLLGLAYWAHGDLEAAYGPFAEGLFQNDHDLIQGTLVLVDLSMTLGRLREAEGASVRGLQVARDYDPPMPLGTEDVYSSFGLVHREQGNLEAAARDLAAAKELGDQVELPDWHYRWCIGQARLEESLGNLVRALDLLEEARRRYVRTPLPVVRPIPALIARVWIRQGRLAEALDWAREQGLSVDDEPTFLREFEHITLARLLIATHGVDGEDGALDDALGLLERLLQAAEGGNRMGSALEILVLEALAREALAREAKGDLARALVPLERALSLAEPEGFFQTFVDEGPPMGRLLYAALNCGIAPAFVRRLLAGFPVAEPEPARRSLPAPKGQELIEPLSEREIEVLQLVAEGFTNSEIASRLFLSLNTVKGHTRNIYGKLGVHSRTQAVARARALGILSPVDRPHTP